MDVSSRTLGGGTSNSHPLVMVECTRLSLRLYRLDLSDNLAQLGTRPKVRPVATFHPDSQGAWAFSPLRGIHPFSTRDCMLCRRGTLRLRCGANGKLNA